MPNIPTNSSKLLPWLLVLISMLASVKAHAVFDNISVDVNTGTGKFAQVYVGSNPSTGESIYQDDPNKPCYIKDVGELYVKQGFVPIARYPERCSEIDPVTLNAINGKTVISLALWLQIEGGPYANNFKRSTETYTISSVPYVIVSVKSSTGGNGGNSGNGNFTKPTVTINADQPNAAESGIVPGRISIALNGARSKAIKVLFTVSGTATKRKDYQAFNTSVTIPISNTSAYVDIYPIDDLKKEKTEKIKLTLKPNNAYKLGKAKAATVTITDND